MQIQNKKPEPVNDLDLGMNILPELAKQVKTFRR
jgi:hypothetical protein